MLMSAEVYFAIIPSNVLFPTPLPPKIPMRWPIPQVSRASMDRTPVCMDSRMGSRSMGFDGSE
jgi:hypothetical protein